MNVKTYSEQSEPCVEGKGLGPLPDTERGIDFRSRLKQSLFRVGKFMHIRKLGAWENSRMPSNFLTKFSFTSGPVDSLHTDCSLPEIFEERP